MGSPVRPQSYSPDNPFAAGAGASHPAPSAPTYSPDNPFAKPATPPTRGSWADAAAQALSGGLAPDLVGAEAAIGGLLHGDTHLGDNYVKARDKALADAQGFAARNPKTNAAIQAVGGVVPTAAVMLGTGGAGSVAEEGATLAERAMPTLAQRLPARMLGGSAIGAATEQVGRFNSAPGTLSQRAQAVQNAGLPLSGMLFGAASPAVPAMASSIMDRLKGDPGTTRALGKVLSTVEESGQTFPEVIHALQNAPEDVPVILADAMGTPGQRLVRSVTDKGGFPASQLQQKLATRQAGQYSRWRQNTTTNMGQGFQTLPEAIDAATEYRRSRADQAFGDAGMDQVHSGPVLDLAMKDPQFRAAIEKGGGLTATRDLTKQAKAILGDGSTAGGAPLASADVTPGEVSEADLDRARNYGRLAGNTNGSLLDPARIKSNPYRPGSPLYVEWEQGFNGAYDPLEIGSGLPKGVGLNPQGNIMLPPDRAAALPSAPTPAPVSPPPAGQLSDHDALYQKLLAMNGNNRDAADEAMAALWKGKKAPVPSAEVAGTEPRGVTFSTLDNARQYLNKGIQHGFNTDPTNPGTSIDRNTAHATLGLLNAVMDEATRANPKFGAALSQFADDSRPINALVETGKHFMNNSPAENRYALRGVEPTSPEMNAVRTAAMSEARNNMGSKDYEANLMNRWLNSPDGQENLQLLAPNADAAAKMQAFRDWEQKGAKVNAAPSAGSNTSTNIAGLARLGQGQTLGQMLANPMRAKRVIAGALGSAIDAHRSQTLTDALAPLLGTERSGLTELQQRLQAARDQAALRTMAAKIAAGTFGLEQRALPASTGKQQ